MSGKVEQGPYKDNHWAQHREHYRPPTPPPSAPSQASSQQPGYPAPSPYAQQPPSTSAPPSSEMLTLPPPPQSQMAQDPYRQPGQYDPYAGQHGQMPYPPHQQPQQQQQQQQPVNFAQPAPRQRTAIACRYCRRRKIRCHGFDLSPDGRCTNCARFHQECIFTPVSSQAHAFVPAHTAYPHLRNTGRMPPGPDGRPMYAQGQPPIYGAHGQPLPMPAGQESNYSAAPPPPSYGSAPYPHYDERGPPPSHAQDSARGAPPARRSSGAAYEYPDPTQMAPISPANSNPSYAPGPYPPQSQQQPYYSPQRRPSPPTYPSYDARSSTSPHGSTSSTSNYPNYGGLHPPQALPPANYDSSRTPPPTAARETNGTTNGQRPTMRVSDMLAPADNSGLRSSADSDMLKALNRRGM